MSTKPRATKRRLGGLLVWAGQFGLARRLGYPGDGVSTGRPAPCAGRGGGRRKVDRALPAADAGVVAKGRRADRGDLGLNDPSPGGSSTPSSPHRPRTAKCLRILTHPDLAMYRCPPSDLRSDVSLVLVASGMLPAQKGRGATVAARHAAGNCKRCNGIGKWLRFGTRIYAVYRTNRDKPGD